MNLGLSSSYLDTLAQSIQRLAEYITSTAQIIAQNNPRLLSPCFSSSSTLFTGTLPIPDLGMHTGKFIKYLDNIYVDLARRVETVIAEVKAQIHTLIRTRSVGDVMEKRSGMNWDFGAGPQFEQLGFWSMRAIYVGIGVLVIAIIVITALAFGRDLWRSVGPRDRGGRQDQFPFHLDPPDDDITMTRVKTGSPNQSVIGQENPRVTGPTFTPPHLVLIKYIYPTSSIWPPTYLQAFSRAQASHIHSQATAENTAATQTHIDTPPAANTRRQRDSTARRWNGKIFLSKKGVRKDLEDGKVGLRAGIRENVDWEGVEWID